MVFCNSTEFSAVRNNNHVCSDRITSAENIPPMRFNPWTIWPLTSHYTMISRLMHVLNSNQMVSTIINLRTFLNDKSLNDMGEHLWFHHGFWWVLVSLPLTADLFRHNSVLQHVCNHTCVCTAIHHFLFLNCHGAVNISLRACHRHHSYSIHCQCRGKKIITYLHKTQTVHKSDQIADGCWCSGEEASKHCAPTTGHFIMFSMITNIYNKKTKGPTLMELFTATGKLRKFFLDN